MPLTNGLPFETRPWAAAINVPLRTDLVLIPDAFIGFVLRRHSCSAHTVHPFLPLFSFLPVLWGHCHPPPPPSTHKHTHSHDQPLHMCVCTRATDQPTPPLAPPDSQLHSMNLATRHSCVKIEGWGALVSSWVGRHGWGQGRPRCRWFRSNGDV